MREVKLAILIPSMDYWLADFAVSMLGLEAMLHYHPFGKGFKYNIINERGSLIVMQRQSLAEQGLEWGATHFLWLDSDMRFKPDLCHKLMKHNLPMVACNYVKRIIPAMPNTKSLNGKLIATSEHSTGLVEADSTGFGAVLMKTEILEKMPKPWFDTVWVQKEDKQEMIGEDVFFFRLARKFAGAKLMIDHDVSKSISHIGTFEYTNNLADLTWDEIEIPEMKERMMA